MVTVETGSGKSTQLLQYAAEYFGGLVVCTQPRVIVAISLARRVADEYNEILLGSSAATELGMLLLVKTIIMFLAQISSL